MIVLPLIERKRDGGRLAPAEWRALADAYAAATCPTTRWPRCSWPSSSAGLDRGEIGALTDAMLAAARRSTSTTSPCGRVDKHSTGRRRRQGVARARALVAALGVAVPMMSGRGLGHTGGTLDKLESVPGFRTDLSLAAATRQLERLGCALIGQTAEIAPADRKMYALRDVTGTVEAVPLIAASIMSKKLAEGLTGLVLDVKRGSGAFIPELDRGLDLARTMVELGADHGCPDRRAAHGDGPPARPRLRQRARGRGVRARAARRGPGRPHRRSPTRSGAEMLVLGGAAPRARRARPCARDRRRARARTAREIVEAQGGNPGVVDDPAVLPQAPHARCRGRRAPASSPRSSRARSGTGIIALGGGRRTVADRVDPAVGLRDHRAPGRPGRGRRAAGHHPRPRRGRPGDPVGRRWRRRSGGRRCRAAAPARVAPGERPRASRCSLPTRRDPRRFAPC
jgi:pyrimidine-nucleoside phosphorylase